MLYTRKGDTGTTRIIASNNGQAKTFGCNQKISKSSAIAEALGALDETNSTLGLIRARLAERDTNTRMRANDTNKREKNQFSVAGKTFSEICLVAQENLFIIQAELAGAEGKTISEEKVKEVEMIVDMAEKEMPPIKSFFIPGATELGAIFDVARTVARRAERRVTAVIDAGDRKIGAHSRAYLNRLSSLLYALARLSNHKSGINEQPPSYR